MRRFTLTWPKDRYVRSDARVLSLARSNTTFRQKSELTHLKAKHLSFASRFGRQRPSREAATQNASAGTEVTSDGYNHLHFLLLSYFEYIAFFGTTIQCYNLTQQYNYNMFVCLHALYKSVGVASPQHAANTSGGSFEVGHFKFSRHHLARREATTG
jgi:hypothetical protein